MAIDNMAYLYDHTLGCVYIILMSMIKEAMKDCPDWGFYDGRVREDIEI